MINDTMILALSPLLPFGSALLLPFLKLEDKNRKLFYTMGVTLCNLLIAYYLARHLQGQSLILFKITENMPILLRVDGLSVLYLLLASFLWLGVTLYSHSYIAHNRFESRYYAFLLAVLGSLMGLGLAGNIITFYLFYELMTFLAFPLICHDMTEEPMKAAITFLIYSIFGATLVLIGIALLNGLGDIALFSSGGILDPAALEKKSYLTIAVLLILFGFGCKAGMFPLQAWLPIAHPAAPAPISAVLSALITKAGVLGIIRVIYYMVGPAHLQGTWLHNLWLAITLLTVFLGSMLAFREPLLKKRLAYSSVSQLSYILFGLAVFEPTGFTGALLQMVSHAFAKLVLFLCVGAIIHQTHFHHVEELKGIGKKMPVVMWCFTLSALSLIGIPPLGGFLSKWHLIEGALKADIGIFSWLGPVVLLISAFLTAGYLLPIIIDAFFPGADYDYANLTNLDPGWQMKGPLIVFAAFALFQAGLPSRLVAFISAMAGGVMGV
ncbi:MAG: proton-conducting transporter membrane subunit [Clostridiales bacterium]